MCSECEQAFIQKDTFEYQKIHTGENIVTGKFIQVTPQWISPSIQERNLIHALNVGRHSPKDPISVHCSAHTGEGPVDALNLRRPSPVSQFWLKSRRFTLARSHLNAVLMEKPSLTSHHSVYPRISYWRGHQPQARCAYWVVAGLQDGPNVLAPGSHTFAWSPTSFSPRLILCDE